MVKRENIYNSTEAPNGGLTLEQKIAIFQSEAYINKQHGGIHNESI